MIEAFPTVFTGKERDGETGLDFFLARYYSPLSGRFTSTDEWAGGMVDPFTGGQVGQPGPLPYADIGDPQTINKYAYVRNNPLRYTDPDGHEEVESSLGPVATATKVVSAIVQDTVVGLAKGTANALIANNNANLAEGHPLAIPGLTPFEAKNTTQASAMRIGEEVGPAVVAGVIPGPKSSKEMAVELSKSIGRDSVSFQTSRTRGHIDLVGKGHFNKTRQTRISTPHVQERTISIGPNGKVNLGRETTRAATKQDIRTAKRLEKERQP
jgi:RHS repeat-associated protein